MQCNLLGYSQGYTKQGKLTVVKINIVCKASSESCEITNEDRLHYCKTEFYTQCPKYVKYVPPQILCKK